MVFLLEWLYSGVLGNEWRDLSEEYLNHMANVASGNTDDGDFFENIHKGFVQYGIVAESAWPYDKGRPYDFAKTSVADSLSETGKKVLKDVPGVTGRFIKPWSRTSPGLSDAQFAEVLDYLRRRIPVAVGRDHSMAAVGFCFDGSYPGSGYFILRDSRGVKSGDKGYVTESFQSVRSTAFDVFVYEKR